MNNFIDVDFEMIKEKYLKSYKKFITYLGNEYEDFIIDESLDYICYCDLEKFFDDNKIFITIWRNELTGRFHIFVDEINNFIEIVGSKYRNDCKIPAIYKAFEIMEGELNEL